MASKLPRIPTSRATTADEEAAVARVVHDRATSPEDERDLLDALGLPTPEVPR